MDTSHDITVLNTLIRTTLDSYKGFNDACSDTEGPHGQFFRQMASERSQVASQLQAQVAALGGEAEDDSSYTAAAHRGFMDLKQAVMGDSDEAVIDEVERGEDYLKTKYEAALQDGELSPQTRQVIEQAYQSVRKGHDTASAMKHQMEG
ncbi:MAG TPA: PA2169 family four-helix-bundle protein [Croceibacterium sp.]|nr:PA2169 family four-helix-bundle protein [Croceibacterium sp.]